MGTPFSSTYIELVLDPSYRNWKERFFVASRKVHMAHLCMLTERGIVSGEIAARIKSGIMELESFEPPEHLPGWRDEAAGAERVEDLYFLYEKALGERIGHENAAWLHTARSRNDMDGTIFRMVLKERLLDLADHLFEVCVSLKARCLAGQGELTVLYTHGQPANPSTTAHYLSALLLELLEDGSRLVSAIGTVDRCLMGACAITGTGFDVDREQVAALLDFGGVVTNTYEAICSSHWLEEPSHALGSIMGDLGRFAADLLHKASCEVGLYNFPDELVQVSSIMPQKRNPVIIEHLRIQAGQVSDACAGTAAMFRNVPFQDVNENADAPVCAFLDALDRADSVLDLTAETASGMRANQARAERICLEFGVTSTELADTIVREFRLGFRAAHGIAAAFARSGGDLEVLRSTFAEAAGEPLPWSDAEIGDILSPERFIAARKTLGGPSPEGMAPVYRRIDDSLDAFAGILSAFQRRSLVAEAKLEEAWGRL
jgi:argininosuccinate lyase